MQDKFWLVLVITGLLIIIQCFYYISMEEPQELKQQDIKLHYVCGISSIFLVTAYLLITGYWWYSPLYYVVTNSQNKKEVYVSITLPMIGTFCVWFPKLLQYQGYPFVLLAILCVLVMTIILYLIEKGINSIMIRDHLLTEQMKVTALNELKVMNLNRELAMKYQLADLNARLEEREHISRNIHNVVGHTITSAIVSLQAYRVLQDTQPQRAEDKLAAADQRMRLALEEIRRAVRVLDQETQEISLKDFQQLMIAELKRFSIDTDLTVTHNLEYIESEQFVDKRTCEFLHSALSECLNNGIRHGNATSFVVYMHADASHIALSVTDNGTGFQQISLAEQEKKLNQGYGIRKMKQFVFEHGGKIKIESESGFTVSIELLYRHAN